MLTATVACPGCSGTMPLSSWTPGRQLRCPRCKATFRLGNRAGDAELVLSPGTATSSVPPAPPPVVSSPSRSPAPVATILPSAPATRAGTVAPALEPAVDRADPSRKSNRLALILGVSAGLLFFIGGTIGLALYVAQQKPTPTKPVEPGPLAQNGGTETAPATSTGGMQPPGITAPISVAPLPNRGPETPPNVVNNPQPMPPVVPVRRLPPELQTKVDDAIEKGVGYLQKYLREDGAINGNVVGYPNGALFLLGLTLLECGVPAKDPRMMALTERVRAFGRGRASKTYEISLALLYLDRLGDAQDRDLIRSLGLQLLAGQQFGGGWTYDCQKLSAESEKQLYLFLEQTRPEKAGELMLRDSGGRVLDLGGKLVPEESLEARSIKGLEAAYNKLQGIQEDLKRFPELQRVPSLRTEEAPANRPPGPPFGRGRGPRLPAQGPGDNSNTQFAALGMWVANRHGVPCERSLALLSARFRTSQTGGGGWGYVPGSGETPAMTCAGLLALAIGHGVRLEDANEKREDEQIQKGLAALARYMTNNQGQGLYYFWSVERVGMLFNLEMVGATDWYRWGVEKLLPAQNGDGSWMMGGYHGSHQLTDTCFALLFLKKSNFVRDLSNKLEQVLDIKGSLRQGTP